MAKKEEVTITKDPNNPRKCKPNKEFDVFRGDEVKFVFDEEPNASITFVNKSPFDEPVVLNEDMKISKNAEETSYDYQIFWTDNGGGSGAGSGDVGH